MSAKDEMRIWTVHPRYLDKNGLLALWREGLLAQAVLLGKTKGYRHHPQLIRFRDQHASAAAIATYLATVHKESLRRGYRFDKNLIHRGRIRKRMPETQGQLLYEWHHLKLKLERRSPEYAESIRHITEPESHPLFVIIPGAIRDWERRSQKQRLRQLQAARDRRACSG